MNYTNYNRFGTICKTNEEWLTRHNDDYKEEVNKEYFQELFKDQIMNEYDILSYKENDYCLNKSFSLNEAYSHGYFIDKLGKRYIHEVEIFFLLIINNMFKFNPYIIYNNKNYTLHNLLNFENEQQIYNFMEENLMKSYTLTNNKPLGISYKTFYLNGKLIYARK